MYVTDNLINVLAEISYYKNIMSYGLRVAIFNNRMLSEGNQFLFSVTNRIAVIADAECNGVRELLLKVRNK